MTIHTLEPILKEHPFFQGLDPSYLTLLTGCAKNVRFEAGEIIFRLGEEASTFYILREGKVSIEVDVPGRGPLTIQTLEGGDVIGWTWLIPPYTGNFDARAVVRTRAIAMDGACLRRKCDQDHDLGYALLQRVAAIMIERLQATRLQLMDLYSNPEETR